MLRATIVESSDNAVTLRVEGRMAGRWVEELRAACELQGINDGIRLILDLAEVSYVDAAGIEFLKELKGRCVTLLSPSPLVAEQLKSVESCGDV